MARVFTGPDRTDGDAVTSPGPRPWTVRHIDVRFLLWSQLVPITALLFTLLGRWAGTYGSTAVVLAVAVPAAVVAARTGRLAVWQALALAPLAFVLLGNVLGPRVLEQSWVLAPMCWSAVAGLLVGHRWWSRAATTVLGVGVGLAVASVLPPSAFVLSVWLAPAATVVVAELARAAGGRRPPLPAPEPEPVPVGVGRR
jgi:hypothetical protein